MKARRNLRAGIAALALAGVVGVTPAAAQNDDGGRADRGPEASLERHIERMDQRLDLSSEQEDQIRTILSERWEQRSAARADRATRRSELAEAMKDVLTPEQQEKMKEMAPPRRMGFDRGRGAEGGRRQGTMGRGSRDAWPIFQNLDLTDQQREQLEAMRQEHRAAVQAWMDANPDATREERREFTKSHREQRQAALDAVLTPEQVEELQSMRQERPRRGSRGRF